MMFSGLGILFVVAYLVFIAVLICIGGYVLGYSFRKGWDRAGRS